MAPPQILEAEHACGVSHVHGAATRARLHTVKYANYVFGRSAVCVSLSLSITRSSKYLSTVYKCCRDAGSREAKEALDRVFPSIIPRALVRLDLSLHSV